jgi:hypothetical protein
VALCVEGIKPLAALNVVPVWPAPIVTLAGAVKSALLLLIEITAGEVADLSSNTVQVVDELELMLVGLQVSELN